MSSDEGDTFNRGKVYFNRDKVSSADDRVAGVADGVDIRGVQLPDRVVNTKCFRTFLS